MIGTAPWDATRLHYAVEPVDRTLVSQGSIVIQFQHLSSDRHQVDSRLATSGRGGAL